ncbi:hypothetical protein GTP58_08390 [Duganella sp. CY15W]|uniref:hypothetical protein n=1 Tax=Duganella sp. CY15W TaxID=2692172 RepID=UPI00136E3A6D|nr:hypothetical protein [Duganella sp. CY15W]MYM28340.1 hypothetical protein [Duganella sp. CY15W]
MKSWFLVALVFFAGLAHGENGSRDCNFVKAEVREFYGTTRTSYLPATPKNTPVEAEKNKPLFQYDAIQRGELIINIEQNLTHTSGLFGPLAAIRKGVYKVTRKFDFKGEAFLEAEGEFEKSNKRIYYLDSTGKFCDVYQDNQGGKKLEGLDGPVPVVKFRYRDLPVEKKEGTINFLGFNDGLILFDVRESENGKVTSRNKIELDPNAVLGKEVSMGRFRIILNSVTESTAKGVLSLAPAHYGLDLH